MKITEADLVDLLNEVVADDPDDHIYPEYSGRGMMGDRCLGLTFDNDSEWLELIVELTARAIDPGYDFDTAITKGDVLKMVRSARSDSMGTGVIYYWPHGGLALTED